MPPTNGKATKKMLAQYKIRGVHPACEAVPPMSSDEFDDLKSNIAANGLLDPIALTEKNFLLDGRNRLRACFETGTEPGFKKIENEPWQYVYSANIARRHLTVGQRAAFAVEMSLAKESEVAKKRQSTSTGGNNPQLVETFPQAENGKARDKAGAKVGVSGRSVDKAEKVKEHVPDLFEDLRQGKTKLEPAYRAARAIEKQKQLDNPEPTTNLETVDVINLDGEIKKIPKPKTVRFNRTNDSIDWARWSWNPTTGCRHGCKFCYARPISAYLTNTFPFGFEPAFYKYRLDAPKNTNPPNSDDPRDGRVFVVSMGDLFGHWVPDEWIDAVFDACLASPEWEYLFLTKWPARYSKMPLLAKAWYGASIVTQADVSRVEKAMQRFDAKGAIKWISLEPMLGPIKFKDLSWCNLVVVGCQTATNQPDGRSPAVPAKFDDVVDVVNQCREWGVPYYLKANMLESPGMVLPKMNPR